VTNREIRNSFDQISAVYDETRDPLEPTTVDRVAAALRREGVGSILEIGIGTGRVARPLTDRGFTITDADLSLGMLGRARAKGLDRIVRASGYRLPFRDGAFDATMLVHVLHMLERPKELLREAARVSRVGTFAIVNPPGPKRPRGGPSPSASPRRLLHDMLRQQGFPIRRFAEIPRRERRVLDRVPADSVQVVEERDVTVTVASRLDLLGRRGHRNLLHVPRPVLARAVRAAKAAAGDRTITTHRRLGLALWRATGRGPRRSTARTGAPSRTAKRRPHGSSRARSSSAARTARRTGPARRPRASRSPRRARAGSARPRERAA
jgi:ubiquinone/menaquinone biosynthesis C-methylase UbiE